MKTVYVDNLKEFLRKSGYDIPVEDEFIEVNGYDAKVSNGEYVPLLLLGNRFFTNTEEEFTEVFPIEDIIENIPVDEINSLFFTMLSYGIDRICESCCENETTIESLKRKG